MAELDLSQDTVRQRRNMVVASILVIFIERAGVTFGNKVNFLGASLNIEKSGVIYNGILIFLAYFTWRFYQYFSTDKAYLVLRSQYSEHMKSRMSLKIVQLICKPRKLQMLSGEYLYKDLERSGFFSYKVDAIASERYDPMKGCVVKNNFTATVPLINLEIYRIISVIVFVFRGRIITDYFVPYLILAYAVVLQFL